MPKSAQIAIDPVVSGEEAEHRLAAGAEPPLERQKTGIGRVDLESALDGLIRGPAFVTQEQRLGEEPRGLGLQQVELRRPLAQLDPFAHLALEAGQAVAQISVEDRRHFVFARRRLRSEGEPVERFGPLTLATMLDAAPGQIAR